MKKINLQKGSSTLEILIAFVILIFAITAVIVIGFGNQSVSADSETNNEALYKAKQILEDARVQSREDFNSLVSILNDDSTYGINYEGSLDIVDISPCLKQASSTVTWQISPLKTQTISIATFLGSVSESLSLGGDCDTEIPDEWDNPISYNTPDPIHPGSSATDVDVIKINNKRYALLTSNNVGSNNTLWVIDVTTPTNPQLISGYKTDETLNAVDAAGNIVYVASASSTAQFQIIDISNPQNPVLRASRELPGVSGSDPGGISIYFSNDRVYIGTNRVSGIGGNEFHVFDVENPSSPVHMGSLEINHNVNEIIVRGDYAYIAASATTPQSCELIVINISNPSNMINPCTPSAIVNNMLYRAPGNFSGTAIDLIGNKIYLGRERAQSSNDFYILNVSNLSNIQLLGSLNLNLNPGTQVVGIAVRSNLAFIVTTDTTPANGGGPFMVWNVSNPTNLILVSCKPNYSETATGFDFTDNLGFVSNESQDSLRIFYDQTSSCTPSP